MIGRHKLNATAKCGLWFLDIVKRPGGQQPETHLVRPAPSTLIFSVALRAYAIEENPTAWHNCMGYIGEQNVKKLPKMCTSIDFTHETTRIYACVKLASSTR
jgi:hypothetical protein